MTRWAVFRPEISRRFRLIPSSPTRTPTVTAPWLLRDEFTPASTDVAESECSAPVAVVARPRLGSPGRLPSFSVLCNGMCVVLYSVVRPPDIPVLYFFNSSRRVLCGTAIFGTDLACVLFFSSLFALLCDHPPADRPLVHYVLRSTSCLGLARSVHFY